ncbi:hypothetical protein EJ066_12445 [Mesorhizobium sp. M9A.F.Ca.ET.002.03.1.2]|nr:hypothetical protein EJ066_12445 [Mesorhizobium sp. M9A.F.Ca.ET.002.03.1.2]
MAFDPFGRFARLQDKAQARTGRDFALVVIQEAGLDGFWIHRILGAGTDLGGRFADRSERA